MTTLTPTPTWLVTTLATLVITLTTCVATEVTPDKTEEGVLGGTIVTTTVGVALVLVVPVLEGTIVTTTVGVPLVRVMPQTLPAAQHPAAPFLPVQ